MSAYDGMVKLIYSSAFDNLADVGMRIVEDPRTMAKSASTIFNCGYDDLKPDKDHMGIHLTALGDAEHYGFNRNGDAFPKQACVAYHDTFVKHGHVYRHHRNKDPEKALGHIKASAYNEPMGRIELYVHAHREKCADELQKLASDGEIPFSMACKVAFDRCNRCGNIRKSSRDPNQCDHVRDDLGKMAEDGSITGTYNDEPKWFDISFVGRPADRIAWDLKVASDEPIDSVKLAEVEGIWVPDHIAIESSASQRKLELIKKLASTEEFFAAAHANGVKTAGERYLWELRKAAGVSLSDEQIESLRCVEPQDAFYSLAKAGCIMDFDSFMKYAFGPRIVEVQDFSASARDMVRSVYSDLQKRGECQMVCNEHIFDVNPDPFFSAPVVKLAHAEVTLIGPDMERRAVEAALMGNVPQMCLDKKASIDCNDGMAYGLAVKYAAYKLSAVEGITALNTEVNTDALIAVAVAQNKVQ